MVRLSRKMSGVAVILTHFALVHFVISVGTTSFQTGPHILPTLCAKPLKLNEITAMRSQKSVVVSCALCCIVLGTILDV